MKQLTVQQQELYRHTLLIMKKTKGMGHKTQLKVAALFSEQEPSSIENMITFLISICKTMKRLPSLSYDEWFNKFNDAQKEIAQLHLNNIGLISMFDGEYPQSLLSTPLPPCLLFTKGNLGLLKKSLKVAVIGTRQPADKVSIATKRIAKMITEHNGVVISGLALGCDTQAHSGAIDGRTVAVLPCGLDLDSVYPKENAELANLIIEHDGLLISEYPSGQTVTKYSLIERDRLQAYFADSLILAQSKTTESGSMHAVRVAFDLNKPVAAIIGLTHDNDGGDWVIEQKGTPLTNKEDLKSFLVS